MNCGVELSLSKEEIEILVEEEHRTERARELEKQLRYLCFVTFLFAIAGLTFRFLYRDVPRCAFLPFPTLEPVSFDIHPSLTMRESEIKIELPTYSPPPPRKPDADLNKMIQSLKQTADEALSEIIVTRGGGQMRVRVLSETTDTLIVKDLKTGVIFKILKSDIKERKPQRK